MSKLYSTVRMYSMPQKTFCNAVVIYDNSDCSNISFLNTYAVYIKHT